MMVKVKVNLTDEEQKRWDNAHVIMWDVYGALPANCEAEEMLRKAIDYFEEFAEKYMED